MSRPPPAAASTTVVAPTLDTEVIVEDDRWRSYPDIAHTVCAAAEALVSCEPGSLATASATTIALSDDARVMALNRDFRGKPTPTNVLSFPADPRATPPGEPAYLGDVIIARQTVEREAHDLGVPVAHHVSHLVVHGLLHLLGHDHQVDADAERMEAIETRVLRSLGIPDPYAPLAEPDAPPESVSPSASRNAR